MLSSTHLIGALALSFLGITEAAIGPVADLEIVNKFISPDGFGRALVLVVHTPLRHAFS